MARWFRDYSRRGTGDHHDNVKRYLPSSRLILRYLLVAGFGLSGGGELQAQLPPFAVGDDGDEVDDALPENVPSDLIEPALTPRTGSADRFSRIFSAELRDIEERQAEILAELENLPPDLRWREWMRRIEAVLFASASPVPREDLARVVGQGASVDLLIEDLTVELADRPYEIAGVADRERTV